MQGLGTVLIEHCADQPGAGCQQYIARMLRGNSAGSMRIENEHNSIGKMREQTCFAE